MSFIKAIETKYSGVLFRSRLEARWAVFYDSLELKWSYELEGFELKSGRYLPDFFLPELNVWIEIKGKNPTDEEQRLCQELSTSTDKSCYIFFGDIPSRLGLLDPYSTLESAYILFPGDGWDCQHWWCECPLCGKVEIQYMGFSDRINCKCEKNGRRRNFDSKKLLVSYERARSARFEFR